MSRQRNVGMRLFPWLVLGILGIASVPSWAQVRVIGFNTGKIGICPSAQEVERFAGRGLATTGAGWTFVLAANAQTFQSELSTLEVSDVRPSVFSKVAIYAYDRDRQRALVSWGPPGKPLCAWIPRSALLIDDRADPMRGLILGPPPLRVGQIDRLDPDNALAVKAVLGNPNVKGDEGVPAYVEPGDDKVSVPLRLFEHFTVYARRSGKRRTSSDPTHYLLGKSEFGQEQLVGWVHVDNVYLWNSRMAVSWKGSGKGQGWLSEDMKGNPIVKEPQAEPAKRSVAHFPVLQMVPGSLAVLQAADKLTAAQRTPLGLSKLVDKYKIAIPGTRAQPTQHVWVRPVEKDGARDAETLSYWVAMDKDRLRSLRHSFEKICEIAAPSQGSLAMGRIKDGIQSAVSVGAGWEVDPGKTLATALSLPFSERTGLLNLSIETISQLIQKNDSAQIIEVRRRFCRSRYLLAQVEGGQRIDPQKIQFDPRGNVIDPPREALVPYDWFVKPDRGEGIYYVPVEYLP